MLCTGLAAGNTERHDLLLSHCPDVARAVSYRRQAGRLDKGPLPRQDGDRRAKRRPAVKTRVPSLAAFAMAGRGNLDKQAATETTAPDEPKRGQFCRPGPSVPHSARDVSRTVPSEVRQHLVRTAAYPRKPCCAAESGPGASLPLTPLHCRTMVPPFCASSPTRVEVTDDAARLDMGPGAGSVRHTVARMQSHRSRCGRGAVPNGADALPAVASGPACSPYNAHPSVDDRPAGSVPTQNSAPPKPRAVLPAQPKLNHRDTLVPDPDPTPGEERPHAQLTAVTAAPKAANTVPIGREPLRPAPERKSTAVVSLPGLAPAGSPRPDRLPPAPPPVPVVAAADKQMVPARCEGPVASPLVQAMRRFLDNHPGDAMLCLKGYDKDNQELLLLLLPLSARLAEGKLSASNVQDTMYFYDQLNSLLVRLPPAAEPGDRQNLLLSRHPWFWDVPATAGLPRVPAWQPRGHYVQVQNFSSAQQVGPNGAPVYVTRLRTSAEIVTRDKRSKVWPAGNDRFVFHRDGPDICQALRHDYFDHCYFTLPRDLPPGSYMLSIQTEDVPTKRVAREALDFIVR